MTTRTENIEVNFDLSLKKDLQENEVICPKCGGTGLQVSDNPFGLASDKDKYSEMFPHRKQTITGCSHCYNGVQRKCEHCNELLGRKGWCDCIGYKNKQAEKQHLKDLEKWNKALKTSVEEHLKEDYTYMLYLDNYDQFFEDIDDVIEFLRDEIEQGDLEVSDIDNMRLFKTNPMSLSFDAQSIIENATEELHENAYENTMKHVEELQQFLDTFAEKIKRSTLTYFPNFKESIVISPNDLK